MLQNDFFYFTPPQIEGNVAKTVLEINASHQIFEGHFPGNPIVPGVCMMQMVKEVLEQVIGAKTRLLKAGDMKFLAVINPNDNRFVNLDLTYITMDDSNIRVDAIIQKDTTVFFKFKGIFIKNEEI